MSRHQNTSIPTATTCPYCGVGCGVLARVDGVEGDRRHPANQGRLCVKGSALHETLATDSERSFGPRVDGKEVDWGHAIARVASAISDAVRNHGPGSVAFYLSGQLLTEDYYAANKLAKGFIGTPHVDTNSRLCMSSAVAAHKRAFGEDCVPGCYEDLELADLLVLAGSNAAWAHPVLYQRMKAAHRAGRKVVVIDPRQTATSELADLHLKLRPGTDTLLFNGLLVWLDEQQVLDVEYLRQHCSGLESTLEEARLSAPDTAAVAQGCDLAVKDVETFYQWFAETERTVTAFSQGINQSIAGTDKGNAIINCHLATGRIGKPGASPFSLTGQPNAMGGREVGGLANTLAAHMDYDTPGARQRMADYWQTDKLADGPGLKAVDLFEAVHRREIKVLWVMGTNPAVSLPESARVREALARCDVVIVSDCVSETDTINFADILLPAAGWGEKDGTVTNSERRISRQRRFLPLSTGVKPDWQIISEVGQALGHTQAFSYRKPADIFREHATLSGVGNTGDRMFNIAALASLTDDGYEQMQPIQWPVSNTESGGFESTARLFSDGHFPTPDGRARLVPVQARPAGQQPEASYPLVVNSGRIRDQWHTMTRTGLASKLFAHREEPFIEAHPDDVARFGLSEGGLATLTGPSGQFVGRVRGTVGQRPGEVFVPIHWNGQFASSALASELMAATVDPVSGQPESKYGIAAIKPLTAQWQARLIQPWGQTDLPTPMAAAFDYWSRQVLPSSTGWWLAGKHRADWSELGWQCFGREPELVMEDESKGTFRAVWLKENRLEAVLLVESEASSMPGVEWLDQCFADAGFELEHRWSLLAAGSADIEPAGALVCSCFQVGENAILRAIGEGCNSVEALGTTLKCGSNCGSCLPEVQALLNSALEQDTEDTSQSV